MNNFVKRDASNGVTVNETNKLNNVAVITTTENCLKISAMVPLQKVWVKKPLR
jgi:hypothetical protein